MGLPKTPNQFLNNSTDMMQLFCSNLSIDSSIGEIILNSEDVPNNII